MTYLTKTVIFLVIIAALLFSGNLYASASENDVDYDDLFSRVMNPKDTKVCTEVKNALIDDTEGFIADLAFRDAQIQQAAIEKLVKNSYTDQRTVMLYLISRHTAQNISERTLICAISYALDYLQFADSGIYGDSAELIGQALIVNEAESEGLSEELARAIIGDRQDFFRVLARESTAVQERVTNLLGFNCFWTLGNVLVDVLEEIKSEGGLTDAELSILNAVRQEMNGVEEPCLAVGPDPEELANRNTEPQETEPEMQPTEPETELETQVTEPETEPYITEPASASEQDDSSNTATSIWIILLIFLPAAGLIGFFVGREYQKKWQKRYDWIIGHS